MIMVGSPLQLYEEVMKFYKTYVASDLPSLYELLSFDASLKEECIAYFDVLETSTVGLNRSSLRKLYWLCHSCFFAIYSRYFVTFRRRPVYDDMISTLQDAHNKVSHDDFEYESTLGCGASGIVVKCRKKSTGVHYAMKIQHKQGLIDTYAGREWRFEDEKDAYISLDHPFIVKMEFALQTNTLALMALELATVGDLRSVALRLPNERFSREHTKFYGAEIAHAIAYLHKKGILYRDLKPGNVLLFEDGHIKLTDFGSCIDLRGETLVGSLSDNMVPLFQRTGMDTEIEDMNVTAPLAYLSWAAAETESVQTFKLTAPKSSKKTQFGSANSDRSSQQSFGSIDMVPYKSRPRTSTLVGTCGYLAPEVFNVSSRIGLSSFYTYSCDWFSFGSTLYRLYMGRKPFDQLKASKKAVRTHEEEVAADILGVELSPDNSTKEQNDNHAGGYREALVFDDQVFSNDDQEFITALVDFNPVTRLGSGPSQSDEVLGHKYFESFDFVEIGMKLVVPPPLTPLMLKSGITSIPSSVNKKTSNLQWKKHKAAGTLADRLSDNGVSDWEDCGTLTRESTEFFKFWNCSSNTAILAEIKEGISRRSRRSQSRNY